MYRAASDVYDRLHSVSANCSRSDSLIMGDDQTNKRILLDSIQARL